MLDHKFITSGELDRGGGRRMGNIKEKILTIFRLYSITKHQQNDNEISNLSGLVDATLVRKLSISKS
jgi:hypothetical protein